MDVNIDQERLKELVDNLIEALKPIIENVIEIVRDIIDQLSDPENSEFRRMLADMIQEQWSHQAADIDQKIRSPTEPFPDEAGQPIMNFDRPKIGGGQPPEQELRQHDPPPSE